jgi:N-methylhydantoinase B
MGTWGAAPTHDGAEGVPHIGANQSNVPVEMIEAAYPIRIEHYGMVPDTGGPGTFRGGLSLCREYRMLVDDGLLNIRSDKRDYPPHGLFGGEPGAPSLNRVERRDGETLLLPTLLAAPVPFRAGDLFHHEMASGGGHGDPLTRDPDAVLEDVLDGKVTPAHARAAYGVVLCNGAGNGAAVDAAATAALRAQRRGPAEGGDGSHASLGRG